MHRRSQLVVLSGPAGSGKTTLAEQYRVRFPNIRRVVTATTRSPRMGERDGEDYYFLTRDDFEAGVRSNRFVEFTQFNGQYYGTPRDALDRAMAGDGAVLLVIEVDGAESIRFFFPDAVFVFVVPPGPGLLRRRLEGRGTESPQEVDRRLDIARRELARLEEYDFLVVNNDLDQAISDLDAILRVTRRSRIVGGEAAAWEAGEFSDWK